MDSAIIYERILTFFQNYDYKLFNSFIYNWESDFFAMSKSGYFIEVEIKISRGDFFKDFEKEKHSLFKDHLHKKSHHVYRLGNSYHHYDKERLICEFIAPDITFQFNGDEKRHRLNWNYGQKNGRAGYWVNDHGRHTVIKHKERIFSKASKISIKPLEEINCPNQFYYAVPKGLIKIDELPAYAGLIEIGDDELWTYAEMIKKAPYLHKRKPDITKILLKKFHNLWQYKTSRKEKIEIYSEFKDS